MNGVRKHCSDKEVVSLAKVLIRNWKRLLGERGKVTLSHVFFPAPGVGGAGLMAGTQSMVVE